MSRFELKKNLSKLIRNIQADTERLKGIGVGGDFSKKKKYPYVVVGISKTNPITDKATGIIAYDSIDEISTIAYITDYSLFIRVLAEIDEEAEEIAEIIVDKIRSGGYTISISNANVRMFDSIYIGQPKPIEMGALKGFSVPVLFDVRVTEIKIRQGE